MSSQSEIFTSENNTETSYTQTGVDEWEYRYYQIVVEDFWGLQSTSNLSVGHSHILYWFVKTFGGNGSDICRTYEILVTNSPQTFMQ